MKDDYLWNRAGEADPEIEHLERVLGQLRHQRTGADILPAVDIKPRAKPARFSKMLLLAASFAFVALALTAYTVYRQTRNRADVNAAVVMVTPVTPVTPIEPGGTATGAADEPEPKTQEPKVNVSETRKPNTTAVRPRNLNRSREQFFDERERAEGLMAKEQLIKALEITSSKLNSVQRKVQGDKRQGPTS
jgi:hypothetical protein